VLPQYYLKRKRKNAQSINQSTRAT
jgi:hypothetical protein